MSIIDIVDQVIFSLTCSALENAYFFISPSFVSLEITVDSRLIFICFFPSNGIVNVVGYAHDVKGLVAALKVLFRPSHLILDSAATNNRKQKHIFKLKFQNRRQE